MIGPLNTEICNDWRAQRCRRRRRAIEARFFYAAAALCSVMGWLMIYYVINMALPAIASIWAPF